MASTSLNSMLKVFKMWKKMKVFPMLCFTKLFNMTFCPSDKLLCKILCCDVLSCDFLSYMFCQNAKFKLWLFVLWLFVRDFLSCDFLSYIQISTLQYNSSKTSMTVLKLQRSREQLVVSFDHGPRNTWKLIADLQHPRTDTRLVWSTWLLMQTQLPSYST